MSLQVVGFHSAGYRVNTEIYEGPLDLLLDLIERAELDITKLALAQVTDQYLEYIKQFRDKNAAEISAFLVMAARLLQIKSAALLPRPSIADTIDDNDEDSGEALVRQLMLYKRFKELALWLKEREEQGFKTYLRVANAAPKIEAKLDMSSISLGDLIQAARGIFANEGVLTELSKVVNIPRVTIRERIYIIMGALNQSPTTSFRGISKNCTRLELIVSFLALLELVKRRIIEAQQEGLFGDIQLQLMGEWKEDNEEELEFGD